MVGGAELPVENTLGTNELTWNHRLCICNRGDCHLARLDPGRWLFRSFGKLEAPNAGSLELA
jgi:hypothetical protein